MTTTATSISGFQGQILHPHNEGYDEARRLWNGAIDRRPAIIARCTSAADVATAVRFGTRHDLTVAVRGGGHSIPGLSMCDGGLVVDLSLLKDVEIDPVRRRAHVAPGVLLGEYDAAAQAHGLASPAGEISHTGVAGLTLGGGVGWLSRKYGLACDNLVEAELVTATGDIVTVDESTDPELLWGLRGGGGNFGVVTRFTFTLHEVGPLLAGAVMVPMDQGRAALRLYAELCAVAPEELSLSVACVTAPPAPFVPAELVGRQVVVLSMAWVGDPQAGEPWAARLRGLRPAVDLIGLMPYTALQSMVDSGVPHGRGYYVKSEWLGEIDEPAIDTILESLASMPGPHEQILLRHMGGAIRSVPADGTAFTFREAENLLTIACGWDVETDAPEPHVAWGRELWAATRRISTGGAYVNQLDADEGIERVREAYGTRTWDRLTALKRRMDPDNVFRLNQNIPPAPR